MAKEMRKSPRKPTDKPLSKKTASDQSSSTKKKNVIADSDNEEPNSQNRSDSDNNDDNDRGEYDFAGDEYLDKHGNSLKEDKKLQIQSFTLLKRDKSNRYMLILDLARSMGVQDSFRFMKMYPDLPRINIEQDEREGLIDQGVVHPIMKFRNVPVVAVVAAYKKFGKRLFDLVPIVVSKKEDKDENTGGADSGAMAEDDEDSFRRHRMALQALKDNVRFDHLENVSPPYRENGDWMFNCALAAAKFNVGLRIERYDRLWGEEEIVDESGRQQTTTSQRLKRRNYRENDSDDDFDDSDDESENGGSNRRKQFRLKNGFYDVHTNVTQIPRSTQIEKIKIETAPLKLDDLLKKKTLADESESLVALALEQKKKENEQPIEESSHAPGKSLSDWLGPKYAPKNPAKYPIALAPGQYQGSFSIYSSRFLSASAQAELDMANPLANAAALAQMVGAANIPPVINTLPVTGKGKASSAGATAAATPTTVTTTYYVNGKMHTTTEVTLTDSGGRRRSILDSAPVSPAAISLNNNTRSCSTCDKDIDFGLLPGVEPTDREPLLICNIELVNANAIQCTRCYSYYHIKCLEHSSEVMHWKIRTYKWECNDCKLCSRCFQGEEKVGKDQISLKGNIVFCDSCDRGWHQGCFTPPMQQLPDGTWICEMCAKCNTCGAQATSPFFKDLNLNHRFTTLTSAKGEERKIYLASLCDKCVVEYDADKFCPVCMKACPTSSENVPLKKFKSTKTVEIPSMAKCKDCERWVHYQTCDPQAVEKYGAANLDDPKFDYTCPICRLLTGKSLEGGRKRQSKRIVEVSDKFVPLELEEEDADELERKRALQDKVYHRKRGRPRKIRPEEELRVLTLEDVRRPIKPRELVKYKENVVVVPTLRILHDWEK